MDFPTSPGTPRRKGIVDRFVPRREGVNLEAAFSVASSLKSPPRNRASLESTDSKNLEHSMGKGNVSAQQVYSTLLKSEMFGNTPEGTSASPEPSPPRSLPHSTSSLSLPTTPKRRKEYQSRNMFKYSPKKLLRSDSDLSDISLGGGSAGAGGGGLGSSLRPESREFLQRPQLKQRKFAAAPYKVLDAPRLVDDFYLNLIEWGPTNWLAVGLGRYVYLWDSSTGEVHEAANLGANNSATSVSWSDSGMHLAVGTADGTVQIWDVERAERLRSMGGHVDRASSLAWNNHILSTGSRDHSIIHHDVRVKEHIVSQVTGHRGEVCGLKWNTDMQQLASGANDNKIKIWSGVSGSGSASADPLYEFDEHTSAVKALAWSPHQRGLLASGGGFCDRKIWFWNTQTGKSVSSIDTGSQVCNLAWNPRSKELVSTHGNTNNDIIVWKYPAMQPLTRLRGHAYRVLYMSLSPDGSSLATGAGDETLRLWSLYDKDERGSDDSILNFNKQLR